MKEVLLLNELTTCH